MGSLSDFPGFEAAQNLQYLSTARKVFANDKVYGEWEVVEHSSGKPSQGDVLDLSQIKQELQTIENDDEEIVEVDSGEQEGHIQEIAEENSPAPKENQEVIIFPKDKQTC